MEKNRNIAKEKIQIRLIDCTRTATGRPRDGGGWHVIRVTGFNNWTIERRCQPNDLDKTLSEANQIREALKLEESEC